MVGFTAFPPGICRDVPIRSLPTYIERSMVREDLLRELWFLLKQQAEHGLRLVYIRPVLVTPPTTHPAKLHSPLGNHPGWRQRRVFPSLLAALSQ